MEPIYIYDQIGGEGITASQVIEQLSERDGDIEVRINSGGGIVSQGVAIYNAIKGYKGGNVAVYVDGLAASIASIIALSGDELIMAEGSLIMWHHAHTQMAGNAVDFRKEAEVLEQHNSTLIDIYESNTPLNRDEIDAMMAEETWLTASEAYELGIATGIGGELKQAASVNIDHFNNAPNSLLEILDLGNNIETEEKKQETDPGTSLDTIEGNDNFARLEAAHQRLAIITKLASL